VHSLEILKYCKSGEIFTFRSSRCNMSEEQNKAPNVLVVYAHLEPKSFNGALKDTIVDTLKSQGSNVVISDLYAMNFNPVASRNDIKGDGLECPEGFKYQQEMGKAVAKGTVCDDVKAELVKVKDADLIIFQFPVWYSGFPAIMKGWLERVLLENFAFDEQHMYDSGFMKVSQLLFGIGGDISIVAWNLISPFRFVGFDIIKPQVFNAVEYITHQDRTAMLDRCKDRLIHMHTEESLRFVPTKDFNKDEGYVLPKSVVNGQTFGLTIGQHLDLPLPPQEESILIM
ncbi:unnamed protein product, partial [Owenia fusiformis]